MVLNWNGHVDTLECLGSLSQMDYPREKMEIIITDNGSTNGSQDIIKRKFEEMAPEGWHRLILEELAANKGPDAYNYCYARMDQSAFAILRLDNDIVLPPDTLKSLLDILLKNEDAGLVGCKNVRHSDHSICAGGASFYNRFTGRYKTLYPDKVVECDSVQGNCVLIRVSTVQRLDYFIRKDLVFMSTDETDLMFRAREIGYKTYYNPFCICYHKEGQSTGKNPDLLRYYGIRNNVIMSRKFSRYPAKLVYLSFLAGHLLKAYLLNDKIAVKGIWDGLNGAL